MSAPDLQESASDHAIRRVKVVMLVFNPCVNDSRVIRQAEALAAAGYDVTVLARRAPDVPIRERKNGVDYRRLASPADRWYSWRRRSARLANYVRRDPFKRNLLKWLGGVAIASVQPRSRSAGATATSRGVPKNKPRLAPAAKKKAAGLISRLRPRLNSLVASVFIFEVVDIAVRRQLLALRPDIIHAHDLMTLPAASRAAGDLGARLIYDSHELEMHRNANFPAYAWRRRGRMEKRHIRRTDLVITVSDSIADHLASQYRIPRPRVIMNTPSLISGNADAGATVRVLLGLPPTTPLAIYVGSVTINRGIDTCVRALAHYPELHFATVGPRRKPNEIEFVEIARELGVSDRFHMVDPVASDAVVPFVRDADVSVLPIQNVCLSYYYCMPNKLFESVLGGLPVAVADLVELRKFVERYRCGVIMDETDPADVARAIRQVIEKRRDYLPGKAAMCEIRSTYTWPAQAARLVEAYRRLSIPARILAGTNS